MWCFLGLHAKWDSIILLYCTAILKPQPGPKSADPQSPDPQIFIPQNIPRKPPVPDPARSAVAADMTAPTSHTTKSQHQNLDTPAPKQISIGQTSSYWFLGRICHGDNEVQREGEHDRRKQPALSILHLDLIHIWCPSAMAYCYRTALFPRI